MENVYNKLIMAWEFLVREDNLVAVVSSSDNLYTIIDAIDVAKMKKRWFSFLQALNLTAESKLK